MVRGTPTGPFEFIHGGNNTTVSTAVPVTLTPAPDLAVTEVIAPTAAEEGTLIDVTWTVANLGAGAATGSWVDRVYLEKVGDPTAPLVELGQFRFNGPLETGLFYTRSEAVRLPVQTNDLYRVVVTTNHEHGGGNTPLEIARHRFGIEIHRVALPTGDNQWAQLYHDLFQAEVTALRNAGKRVRAMMWSSPTYLTGTMLPIPELMTVPAAIPLFADSYGFPIWEVQMAASTLSILPIVVVFFVAKRYIVQGFTRTGIHG